MTNSPQSCSAESCDEPDGPCFYCGEATSSYAGDPGRWPLRFCQRDGTGITRYHHTRCVTDRLIPVPAQGSFERAKDYVDNAIASFAFDPPDNQFLKGYLSALEVIQAEAFAAQPPAATVETDADLPTAEDVRGILGPPPERCSAGNGVVKFNLNDKVRVKLTAVGRAVMLKNHKELFGDRADKFEPRNPQETDGWSEWQLWDLMREFGPHLTMGFNPPIETEIQFVTANEPQTASGERLYTLKEATTALEQALQTLSLTRPQLGGK